MSQRASLTRRRRRLPLGTRIALLLLGAAFLPLIATVLFSYLVSRPNLTQQATQAMQTDAQNRVQLIDRYIKERITDAVTLSLVQSVQDFYVNNAATEQDQRILAIHATYSLEAGLHHDPSYTNWTLFDLKGKPILTDPKAPSPHGTVMVKDEYLQKVSQGGNFSSEVYYDPQSKKPYIEIYAPIKAATAPNMPPTKIVGFIRASLNLDYVNNIIHDEKNANGDGSYAFLLDHYGVRIADTQDSNLISAVAPVSQDDSNTITKDLRYGTAEQVNTVKDDAVAKFWRDTNNNNSTSLRPTNKNEDFQIIRKKMASMPWTYFVLSPVNTITAVENQQLQTTSLIAGVAALIALLAGLLVGRLLSRPIIKSVEYLQHSTEDLNSLSTRQKKAASEQTWVVDSSQVGLNSVQYYTEAANVAAHQLTETANELSQRWGLIDAQSAQLALQKIITTAQYIENAAQYQSNSNQKLSTAIKVTTQVTEQLANGATSASEAANQLEEVVNQLRYVVGR